MYHDDTHRRMSPCVYHHDAHRRRNDTHKRNSSCVYHHDTHRRNSSCVYHHAAVATLDVVSSHKQENIWHNQGKSISKLPTKTNVSHSAEQNLDGCRKRHVQRRQPSRRFSASHDRGRMIWFFTYRTTIGWQKYRRAEFAIRNLIAWSDNNRTCILCCKTQYQMAIFCEAQMDWKKPYRAPVRIGDGPLVRQNRMLFSIKKKRSSNDLRRKAKAKPSESHLVR